MKETNETGRPNLTETVFAEVRKRGMKITELAKETGLPYDPLWKCSQGTRKLRGDEFLLICEALDKDPREFMQKKSKEVA